jgi:hypothetical protein
MVAAQNRRGQTKLRQYAVQAEFFALPGFVGHEDEDD